jgi:ketosteroid isomerase-like protein
MAARSAREIHETFARRFQADDLDGIMALYEADVTANAPASSQRR